ncbi:gamma-glutamylcyclotransferase [Vibrio fluvialis]|uniref:gamma-glutamylcyclotransferase family protein n=1 Tax=Vibrio fluvialis TaxID=676 RepID=UPI00192C29DA|nr:gamma-glutamylcyclotransferase family protein [Vibrio fluvialis]MBL4242995.1 gamma-glutamylcyclotransferase [Vibrio fluvialis]MBL4251924.1 gamma-glutamylcyclotransferase [Vibrio fluvialis]MBY7918365.1 gamma-glutamylcyclotransferase [Vibrio fluvialis]MBY7949921.1 gamma-glutamylcyclotransferase [Vibrio fluvialis]MBY8013833.1 gamma-glutamylcyclotransferase [Vibrio fluvialis]
MYIFGYGSLMNSASRQLTGNTGTALPATVHGLVRYWGKIDDSYVISPLVVNPGEGQVNGVLLEIDEAALAEFDRRERGYQRIALTAEQIETEAEFDREREIWVYVTEQHQPPCERSPIVQTYVDTVLAGCLEVSEAFARHFVEHTVGWHHPLENDRHAPKYGNLAGVSPAHHSVIDDLIANVR